MLIIFITAYSFEFPTTYNKMSKELYVQYPELSTEKFRYHYIFPACFKCTIGMIVQDGCPFCSKTHCPLEKKSTVDKSPLGTSKGNSVLIDNMLVYIKINSNKEFSLLITQFFTPVLQTFFKRSKGSPLRIRIKSHPFSKFQ